MVGFGWGKELTGKAPHPVYDWNKRNKSDPEILTTDKNKLWFRNESYKDSSGNKKWVSVVTRQEMAKFPDHRSGYKDKMWPLYPQPQLEETAELVAQWMITYNILPENVLGHEHVTPHRKADPGPSFPWGWFEVLIEDKLKIRAPHLLDDVNV